MLQPTTGDRLGFSSAVPDRAGGVHQITGSRALFRTRPRGSDDPTFLSAVSCVDDRFSKAGVSTRIVATIPDSTCRRRTVISFPDWQQGVLSDQAPEGVCDNKKIIPNGRMSLPLVVLRPALSRFQGLTALLWPALCCADVESFG